MALAAVSRAWSTNGHLYVANIAETVLQAASPRSYKKAMNMLGHLRTAYPDLTYREENHPFVAASTFADDTKYSGEGWQSYFHYINLPYIEEGAAEDWNLRQNDKNLTAACNDIIAWLSGKQGIAYKQTDIYLYLTDKYAGDTLSAKSYALRMLIHFIGDLEMPFHTVGRYSSVYPSGDSGANSFTLPTKYSTKNLHSLWDKVLYEERNNIPRPIRDDDWAEMQVKVAQIIADHSEEVDDYTVYAIEFKLNGLVNIDRWTEEQAQLAISLYEGVTEGQAVPQAYLDKNIPVAYKLILTGGYRLAAIVDYIFSK